MFKYLFPGHFWQPKKTVQQLAITKEHFNIQA